MLPSGTDTLESLDYFFDGEFFADITTGVDTSDGSFFFDGELFIGADDYDSISASFCLTIYNTEISSSFCTHVYNTTISCTFRTYIGVPLNSISSTFLTYIAGITTVSASFALQIPVVETKSFCFATQIPQAKEISSSFNLVVVPYTPLPVSSVLDEDNPLLGTLFTGGTEVVSSLITNPGVDPAQTPYAMGYSLQAITSLNTCDIIEWSVSRNRQGGSFTVIAKSNVDPPAPFSAFEICGLPATVLNSGRTTGNKKTTYINGVLGNYPRMNKQLTLLAQGTILQGMVAQSPVADAPQYVWQTVAAAAQAIAAAAGITLAWAGPDIPLMDTFIQSGMKTKAALESLAQRVGCALVSPDGNNWIVIPPTQGMGTWEGYLHCSLIKQINGPFRKGDLDFQLSTLPIEGLVRNQFGGFDSSIRVVELYDLFDPPPPIVKNFWTGNTPPDAGKPPLNWDVPGNFNPVLHETTTQTRAQIIVNPEDIGPSFTTNDKDTWFNIVVPVSQDINGKYQFLISNGLFPANANSNQYRLGYIADDTAKNQAFRDRVDADDARRKLSLQTKYENLRYFPYETATVESIFFNSVPAPGNYTTIDYDTVENWTAMIETVEIRGNKSGADMTVSLIKWSEINLANPTNTYDSSIVGMP